MNERILVAYDGSTPAEAALEYALETFPEADVTVAHVVRAPEGYWEAFEDPDTVVPGEEEARDEGHRLLEEAAELAAEREREVTTELETGRPHREIVEMAEDGDYDSIVVGSHGRRGVSRVLLGSVAEKVVRRSPIPVVVVR